MAKNGEVTKRILKQGSGGPFPEEGDLVQVRYVVRVGEKVVVDCRARGVEFVLGDGSVVKGMDEGVASMTKGELAEIVVGPTLAFGDKGLPPLVPPQTTFVMEIELVDVRSVEEESSMSWSQRAAFVSEWKHKGNVLFRNGEFDEASKAYERALSVGTWDIPDCVSEDASDQSKEELNSLLCSVRLNAAQSYLNIRDYSKAIALTTMVLKSDSNNNKALFRRGTAYSAYGLIQEAKMDLTKCRELPNIDKHAVNKQVKILHDRAQQSSLRDRSYTSLHLSNRAPTYDERKAPEDGAHHDDKNSAFAFFEVTIDDAPQGRIEFELFQDALPKTVANFLALCTGEKATTERSLHYKGSKFHRVIKGFMCQGGDVDAPHEGSGGISIYGSRFEDESVGRRHDAPFLLCMANSGPNSNGSQFFVTTAPAPHLDGKDVVFGKVTLGFDVISKIESLDTDSTCRPVKNVVIEDCGVISQDKPEE